jgi:hypothetical protein
MSILDIKSRELHLTFMYQKSDGFLIFVQQLHFCMRLICLIDVKKELFYYLSFPFLLKKSIYIIFP